MKSRMLTAILLAACCAAHAADEPGSNPNVPKTPVAERLAKARAAIDKKDWGTASRELNVAVREDPRNADVHNLLGYSYRKRATPDLAKAFEHYNLALKLDPNHKGAHEYIGEAYLMDRKPEQAQQHLVALEKICGGKSCEEYQDLAKAIEGYKAKN